MNEREIPSFQLTQPTNCNHKPSIDLRIPFYRHFRRLPTLSPHFRRRMLPVTICAAALCKSNNDDAVLVISDRMMTSGDGYVEYKGDHPKVYPLNRHVLCLSDGAIDIARMFINEVKRKLKANAVTTDVSSIAQLCAQEFGELRRRQAEQLYLSCLGLDAASF